MRHWKSDYSEADRASFEEDYQRELATTNTISTGAGGSTQSSCHGTPFKRIEEHDYDGADFTSGVAYSLTMSMCLRGGISEAPLVNQQSADEKTPFTDKDPTAKLWLEWLKNPHSPVYRAILTRDDSLLAGLLPSFSVTGETDWNDSEKLYSAVAKALTSDEFKRHVQPRIQTAMAQLLGALNAASADSNPDWGLVSGVLFLDSIVQASCCTTRFTSPNSRSK